MSISKTGFWNIKGAQFAHEHAFDARLSQAICSLFRDNKVGTSYDFGCGHGQYTQAMNALGIRTVGFDGNPITASFPNCRVLDLTGSFDLPQVDAVLCLEVGEHIPAEFENILITNIDKHVRSGGLVVLSWAVPGQGGFGHVNCKPNEYIRERFRKLGYDHDGLVEAHLRNMATLGWFKNTILAFRKKNLVRHVHRCGGLGNQLFQIANLMSIADDFCICSAQANPHSSVVYTDTILKNLPHECTRRPPPPATNNDPCVINTQNYSTIKDVLPRLISRLDLSGVSTGAYEGTNKAFLHIRGGDYVGNPIHSVDLNVYYTRAVQLFPKDTEFLVFTDDVEYANKQPVLSTIRHTLVEGLNEIESLVLMSRCSVGGVCANSTFSWWGAMLNQNRTLTFPSTMTNDPAWEASSNYAAPCFTIVDAQTPVHCIHLPERTDRYENIKHIRKAYPFLDVRVVDAIRHETGWIGCLRSHKKIVQSAKDAGKPYVIVIEDDCDFIVDAPTLKTQLATIVDYLAEHPEIQVVNGCGNLIRFTIDSVESFRETRFLRSPEVRTTHIIVYNASAYDTVLNFEETVAVDEQLNACQMVYTYPYLARQLPGYSDINKHVVNYTNIDRSMEFVTRTVGSR